MIEAFGLVHRGALTFIGLPFCSKFNWNSKPNFIHQIFSFVAGFLTMAALTAFMIRNSNNSSLLVESTCIWCTGLIMFVSQTVCFIFRFEFRIFVEEMAFKDSMFDMPLVKWVVDTNFDTNKFRKLNELRVMVGNSQGKLLRYTGLVLKGYLFLGLLIVNSYICDAVYKFLTRTNDFDRPNAFPMWFPWSNNYLAPYTVTLLLQSYAGYLCAATFSAFQCIVMLLTGQVIRQLKVLTFIFLNLAELGAELTEVHVSGIEKWQLYCNEILTQTVKHYVMLKRFSNRLHSICRYFYLSIILNASIGVCVTSVEIAMSGTFKIAPDTIKYYTHEVGYIFIVMIHCLLGQQVDNQCEILQQAVTEKWYIYSRGYKRDMLIFKMALDQGMSIYIFGSISLSLPTFTWFLKTGMSFFTLVISVLEEQQ